MDIKSKSKKREEEDRVEPLQMFDEGKKEGGKKEGREIEQQWSRNWRKSIFILLTLLGAERGSVLMRERERRGRR